VKKLPLLITTGIVLFSVGAYFLYDRYLTPQKVSPWDLVPQATIFVYESNDCRDCVQQLQQTSVWTLLSKAALYGKPADSLNLLFDFLNAQPKGQLISAHLTRKDDFDFVFYVPLQASTRDAMLTAWNNVKTVNRTFNNVEIHELKSGQFTWAVVDDIWIGSFTPFLLEDVVRTYTSGNPTFKNEIASVYKLPRIKKDAGNLYVHIRNLGNWMASFASETPDFIKQVGQSSLLDIKTDDENFILNGFSLDSANQEYILSLFNDQVPVPFNLKNLVSNRTIMFSNYGVSDGQKLGTALQGYIAKRKPGLRDSLAIIGRKTATDISKLYQNLGKEIGVCFMEANDEKLSRILLLDVSKKDSWLKTFNTIAEKVSTDTIFFERFSDYEIREIPLYNFPEKMFWPFVSGFSTSYYTSVGNVLIISENIDELKKFLDDIDKEETWGKSVSQNKFLETTLLEANLSVYINTPMAWDIISKNLHPKWQKFIRENRSILKPIGMGAVQMSHLNNSYYTNVTWRFGEKADPKKDVQERGDKIIATFSQGIYKFFTVRNHYTKQDEVLVQDSSRAVSLVSADGKTLWKVQLNDYIRGDVSQIDFYNNGKLQLFFATEGELHIIDRLGNYVNPYPLKIKEKDIEFASVVDYDHSKKYRFMVAGKSGKLWMFDKEGKNLEGWTPKNTEGSLFAAPQHYRIRGKDYIIAVRKDGVVYLINRRGETLKNFPLNLDARPTGDYFLEKGASSSSTNFILVSRDGFRIKFNLEGKVQSRETLIKTTPDAQFMMAKEFNSKSYIIIRQENKSLTVFDESLKEIIESDFIGKNSTDVGYFDFGGGKKCVTLTDRSQDLSYVYDAQGNLIVSLPIESNGITLRPSSGEKPRSFSAVGRSLTIQPL